jgi:AcrR family transcriptional regulator
LLDAATRLFAERGFRRVTVREICDAARANVASVNYHFGDKERLYREVVEAALDTVRGFLDNAMSAPAGATPEHKLAHYVSAHLAREQSSQAARHSALLRELFRHELTEPTAMGSYIIEQAVRPRLLFLAAIVRELVGAHTDEELVNRCVMSIQAQCLFPVAAPVALTAAPLGTPADMRRLTQHVFQFSLAGIRAVAEAAAQSPRPRGLRNVSSPERERVRAAGAGSGDRTNPTSARGAGRR